MFCWFSKLAFHYLLGLIVCLFGIRQSTQDINIRQFTSIVVINMLFEETTKLVRFMNNTDKSSSQELEKPHTNSFGKSLTKTTGQIISLNAKLIRYLLPKGTSTTKQFKNIFSQFDTSEHDAKKKPQLQTKNITKITRNDLINGKYDTILNNTPAHLKRSNTSPESRKPRKPRTHSPKTTPVSRVSTISPEHASKPRRRKTIPAYSNDDGLLSLPLYKTDTNYSELDE